MEITGRIKVLEEAVQVSASFKKRELVVTSDEQYPQHIMIEFTQDKCDLLNYYKIGDSVKVSINLRGREWVSPQGETKYFNSIQGWRIEKLQGESGHAGDQFLNNQMPAQNTPQSQSFNEEEMDDLPFN